MVGQTQPAVRFVNNSRGSLGKKATKNKTGGMQDCMIIVTLSVAKNLVFRPSENLRFARDDNFHIV